MVLIGSVLVVLERAAASLARMGALLPRCCRSASLGDGESGAGGRREGVLARAVARSRSLPPGHSSLGAVLVASSVGLAALLPACGSAGASAALAPGREQVLERGGELWEAWPERSLEVTGEVVRVWGLSEVPDGSRLQLALSGVDAITRAELLKAVRVRVQSVLVDALREDVLRVSLQTTESVAGVLDRAGPLPHGWARVRRGDEVVLRVWARLEVPRSVLEDALREPLHATHREPRAFVSGLALTNERSQP